MNWTAGTEWRGSSGISAKLRFTGGEAETTKEGEGDEENKRRLEEFNEHPQWE